MKQKTKEKASKKSVEAPEKTLEQERDAYLEGWQRAKADYKNLQDRLTADLVAARRSGAQETLLALLPVIDNVESAYGSVPEHLQEEPWVKGMQFIRQQFEQFLAEQHVEIIPTEGLFDPALHEAIASEISDEAEPGTILRVTRAGYNMGDVVLRPAAVVVAAKPEAHEES